MRLSIEKNPTVYCDFSLLGCHQTRDGLDHRRFSAAGTAKKHRDALRGVERRVEIKPAKRAPNINR
jgi:hypothetical protein